MTEQQIFILSQFGEPEVQNQGPGRATLPLKAHGENSSFPAPGGSWICWLTDASLQFLSLFVSSTVSYKDIFIGFRAPIKCDLLLILPLIISANTLPPNKVTSWTWIWGEHFEPTTLSFPETKISLFLVVCILELKYGLPEREDLKQCLDVLDVPHVFLCFLAPAAMFALPDVNIVYLVRESQECFQCSYPV